METYYRLSVLTRKNLRLKINILIELAIWLQGKVVKIVARRDKANSEKVKVKVNNQLCPWLKRQLFKNNIYVLGGEVGRDT